MEDKSLQPHDWFFKQMFSNPKSLQTVLDLFIPTLASKLDPFSITLVNTEKFSKKSKKFMLDLLFSCKINNEDTFIRFVFEHKSYVDKTLPVQLLYYNAVIWEEAIKKEYYPPIINIVFYHGEREWNIPTNLPTVKDKDLQEYTQKLNYILIDLNKIPDEELKNRISKNMDVILAMLVMKRIFDDIQNLRPILELIIKHKSDSLFIILDYIVLVKKDAEKVEKILKEISGGDEKLMTLTEKWKMEGWMKGKLEGRLEAQRKDIFKLIQLRFGNIPESLESFINKCEDTDKLDEIFTKVALAKSVEELRDIYL
jgi:predicted transposase/invertase (TIGR01784 family)